MELRPNAKPYSPRTPKTASAAPVAPAFIPPSNPVFAPISGPPYSNMQYEFMINEAHLLNERVIADFATTVVKNSEILTELEATKAELEATQARADSAVSERDSVLTELQATKARTDSAVSELEATKAELQASKNSLAQVLEKAKLTQGHQARADNTIHQLRKELAEIENLRIKAVRKLVDYQKTNNIDELIAKLKAAQAERDSAVSDLQATQAERDRAIAELQAMQSERDSSAAEVTSIMARAESTLAELQAIKAEKDAKPTFTFDSNHVISWHEKSLLELLKNAQTELAQNSKSILSEYAVIFLSKLDRSFADIHRGLKGIVWSPTLTGVPIVPLASAAPASTPIINSDISDAVSRTIALAVDTAARARE